MGEGRQTGRNGGKKGRRKGERLISNWTPIPREVPGDPSPSPPILCEFVLPSTSHPALLLFIAPVPDERCNYLLIFHLHSLEHEAHESREA